MKENKLDTKEEQLKALRSRRTGVLPKDPTKRAIKLEERIRCVEQEERLMLVSIRERYNRMKEELVEELEECIQPLQQVMKKYAEYRNKGY